MKRGVSMKKVLKILALALVVILIVMASATYFFLKHINDNDIAGNPDDNPDFSIPDPPKKDERVNVLVMGVDVGDPTNKKAPSRSDTMILASFDPDDKILDFISIPRDTKVKIKGHGEDKIGHAHAFGGPALAMETVGDLFGIDVHYYFRLDYQGFKKFVDNLGGVRVNVPMDMEYYDPYDDPPLYISLKKGWQTLNGEKAIQLVRYRKGYQNGDIGRIETQQAFMSAVIDKVLSAGTILRLPVLAETLSTHLSTNMTPSEMSKYAFKAAGINKEDINMYQLPGDSTYIENVSYFIYDPKKTKDLVATVLKDKEDDAEAQVKVEVLNGSGVDGLAGKVAEILENEGFSVVSIGNADGMNYSTTRVYDRKGKEDNAQRVAKAINISSFEVDLDEKSSADVTIILGKDKSNL